MCGFLSRARRLALAAFVLLLSLWWHLPLRPGARPGVYFTYQSILLFASDIAMLVMLALWVGGDGKRRARRGLLWERRAWPVGVGLWLAAAGASVPVSVDPALSAAFVVHLILLAGLVFTLAQSPPPAGFVARLLTVGLVMQSLIAIAEFALQTTAFLAPLRLPWPGALTPALHGASVVELADGRRWLRAYGTLPHPNILGGYLLLGLAGPAYLYFETGRQRWLALTALGVAGLTLTFSRAAWLGGAAGAAALWFWLPGALRPRAARLAAVSAAAPLVLALAFGPLFLTRLRGDSQSLSEVRSLSERGAFLQSARAIIRERWLLGLGAGAYAEYVGGLPEPHVTPEPVHSVLLLIWAETGLGGLIGLAGVGLLAGNRVWRGRGASAAGAAFAAALAGLAVIALFDHFLWSLPPGRGMLALVVGLALAYNSGGK